MSAMKGPRILITGAAGQLGRALLPVLSEMGEILATGRTASSNGGQLVACDVSRWPEVKQVVSGFEPRVIVNAAAYTNVDANERDPDRAKSVNVRGVEYLLAAGEKSGARLIQIGSDYVFDGHRGPYLEEDATNPTSVYGQTKLEAEKLVANSGTHLVIRTNLLFSPEKDSTASFVSWVVQSLSAGRTIRAVTDQIGNPTLTTHLAQAVARAVEREGTGLYHYGGLEFVSRYEFAHQIAAYFQLPADLIRPITTAELGQLAPRPLQSGLICSKMKLELGVENANLSQALRQAFPLDQA